MSVSWLQLPVKRFKDFSASCACTCPLALKCCSFSAMQVCGLFLYLCAVLEQSVINIFAVWEMKDAPKLPDSSLVHRKELDRKSQDWLWSAKHSCHCLSAYLEIYKTTDK